jgi:hypothetical protein
MVIPVSYSVINHSYGKLDQYLVGSFLELATKRG